MFFNQCAYIGIDLTGKKVFTYAALDEDLGLLALAGGELDDLLAFIGGFPAAVVAINAPARPNQGQVRALLEAGSLASGKSAPRGSEMRMAEYELRQRGIRVAATASSPERCPSWMRSGFALYEKLTGLGFVPHPSGDAAHQLLETHPQAAFIAMTEANLLSASTLEGRLQRQTILYDEGLDIRDGMAFFEEVTRHKLRQGILPFEHLYDATQLDALLAAYIAWLAATQPKSMSVLGDEGEGTIYLPVAKLKAKY